MMQSLSRIWHGKSRDLLRAASPAPSDDPIAELAALIESGDDSQDSLERIHKLLHDRR